MLIALLPSQMLTLSRRRRARHGGGDRVRSETERTCRTVFTDEPGGTDVGSPRSSRAIEALPGPRGDRARSVGPRDRRFDAAAALRRRRSGGWPAPRGWPP